jgi:hypothetical protein
MRSKLVFCNEDGSLLSLWQLHERLEIVCRRAGLRRIRWHDLRHSLASSGVPLRQIQAWLNHSTILMSMRYAHLAPDAGAELISVLEPERRGNEVGTYSSPNAKDLGTIELSEAPDGVPSGTIEAFSQWIRGLLLGTASDLYL